MRTLRLITLATVSLLLFAASAEAGSPIQVYTWSQQSGPGHASAGGTVNTSHPVAGSPGSGAQPGSPPSEHGGGTEVSAPPKRGGGRVSPYPTVTGNSPILKNPGHGGFWYKTPGGQQCLYQPNATEAALCVNVVTPGTPAAPAAPPVDPTTVAGNAAKHLSLRAGQISASPSADIDGLTGAPSWFWLTPTPGTDTVAVTTGGERVTVTATESSVNWSFGDSGTLDAGPGVPYESGAAPTDAVTHDFQTRCLPGDQGHDPDVLASCGPNGYTIAATVAWSISYTATGPIARTGTLTARTTSASTSYPVTEARGFLTSAGSA